MDDASWRPRRTWPATRWWCRSAPCSGWAGCVGVNTLFWQNALSGPENRIIVAPNRDTLYSIAVLDLRAEPMVLTLPEVTDRYYTYQLLDAWTESFAYIGTRATGGRAGTWVITPPGWEGEAARRGRASSSRRPPRSSCSGGSWSTTRPTSPTSPPISTGARCSR